MTKEIYQHSNYQDVLKSIALIAMIIDHLGLYFFPEIIVMRCIGRYAFPIFCFFAGYNFKDRLNSKILIYGTVLYIFSSYAIFYQFNDANILITIFTGQLYLKFFKTYLKNFYIAYLNVFIMVILWHATHFIIEYGTIAIAMIIIGYTAKQEQQNIALASFATCYISFIHTYMIYYDILGIQEYIYLSIIMIFIFFSLIYKSYNSKIDLNLRFIRNNLLNIYCLHLIIIMLIWRYW